MSHAKNKVNWCLKKAGRELEEIGKHRGIIKTKPNLVEARKHISKAEHYLKATIYLKENFSDISASTVFYAMYHCLLAIAAKFGYESGNQECTFALIHSLIEDKEIDFEKELLDKIALSLDVEKSEEKTSIKIREQYQYGTDLSLEENLYKELFDLAKEILSKTKLIIEQD